MCYQQALPSSTQEPDSAAFSWHKRSFVSQGNLVRMAARLPHHLEGNQLKENISVFLVTSCLPTPSPPSYKAPLLNVQDMQVHGTWLYATQMPSPGPVQHTTCMLTEFLLAWCQSPFLPTCITKSGNHSLLSKSPLGSGEISSSSPWRVSTPPGT